MRIKNFFYIKNLFGILLIVAIAPSVYFSVRFIQKWHNYTHLDSKILGQIIAKNVVHTRKYIPQVAYVFVVDHHKYFGKYLYEKQYYINKLSAQQFLQKIPVGAFIWYSSKNPQKSSLERFFPYAELIKAGISLGIFLYFVFLGIYSRRLQLE